MADEKTDGGTVIPPQDDPDTREISPQDILLAPPPPPGGSGQIQVALAMQLIQGGGLHRLPEPIQKALVELADQSDNRGYSYAKASLEKQVELEHAELVDRGKGRKQLLVAIGSIAGGGLTFGTLVTCLMIYAGQYTLAHTVMMSGLAVVGALLGGAGLTTILQKFTSTGDK